jgi:hypothetical protein
MLDGGKSRTKGVPRKIPPKQRRAEIESRIDKSSMADSAGVL